MTRLIIDEAMFEEATEVCPAPSGFFWTTDPAASGDRMRLFPEDGDGCVGWVYTDGNWYTYQPEGAGRAKTMTEGMHILVRATESW